MYPEAPLWARILEWILLGTMVLASGALLFLAGMAVWEGNRKAALSNPGEGSEE